MKRIFTTFILAMAILTSAGAEEKTKDYRFGDIKSISIGQSYSMTYEIHVTEGKSKEVKVVYDKDLEKEIKDFEKYLKVDYSSANSTLYIGMDELPRKFGRLRLPLRPEPIRIYLEMDEISEIDLSGATSISFDGKFTAESLEVDLSGATKFANALNVTGKHLSVDCSGASSVSVAGDFKTVEMDLSGASNTTFKGNAETLEGDFSGAVKLYCEGEYAECDMECSGAVNIEMEGKGDTFILEGSGACKLDAKDYVARKAYVELSGACSAKIQVKDELRHDVNAASKITYYGDPKVTDLSEDKNVIKGTI